MTLTQTRTVTYPSLSFDQTKHRLFAVVFRALDLVRLTAVDYYKSGLEPDDPNQGYQRPPERSRITRIGSYLTKDLSGDGLFPTAVVLGARHPVSFDPSRNEITLRFDKPLQVIDGQHRIAGLRYLLEEKGAQEFADFKIPAVIVEVADRVTEMNQFRVINGTAKSVRTDLVNAILTATVSSRGEDAIKDSERWKVVTTKVIDQLNRNSESPWYGRIAMPDEVGRPKADEGRIVRATSFLTSLRPIYVWLKELGFFQAKNTDQEAEKMAEILMAFWKALADVVPDAFADPDAYVIQKTPGLFSLHLVLQEALLPTSFNAHLLWTRDTFRNLIKDSPEITDPNFWEASANRAAAYGSMKGFRELADLLIDSVRPRP